MSIYVGCSTFNKDEKNAKACVALFAEHVLSDPKSAYLVSYSKLGDDQIKVNLSYLTDRGLRTRDDCTCYYDKSGILSRPIHIMSMKTDYNARKALERERNIRDNLESEIRE